MGGPMALLFNLPWLPPDGKCEANGPLFQFSFYDVIWFLAAVATSFNFSLLNCCCRLKWGHDGPPFWIFCKELWLPQQWYCRQLKNEFFLAGGSERNMYIRLFFVLISVFLHEFPSVGYLFCDFTGLIICIEFVFSYSFWLQIHCYVEYKVIGVSWYMLLHMDLLDAYNFRFVIQFGSFENLIILNSYVCQRASGVLVL